MLFMKLRDIILRKATNSNFFPESYFSWKATNINNDKISNNYITIIIGHDRPLCTEEQTKNIPSASYRSYIHQISLLRNINMIHDWLTVHY